MALRRFSLFLIEPIMGRTSNRIRIENNTTRASEAVRWEGAVAGATHSISLEC
jgi:hypothetical protein